MCFCSFVDVSFESADIVYFIWITDRGQEVRVGPYEGLKFREIESSDKSNWGVDWESRVEKET